jgi:hypothetical protein
MALWIMLKSFKMGSHRILLFFFFQTYPRIGLFEKMMYQRIRICLISIHVSVSMLPRLEVLGTELSLSLRGRMTLGVWTIVWFISHTMTCQPKGLGLHIYS